MLSRREQRRRNQQNQVRQSTQGNRSNTMSNTFQPKSQFTANIRFDSDWHIGSGAGRAGDIDRLVLRDSDGLPFIPAKTLTGIWRDACEAVAWGLDNGQDNGAWQRWVLYLFGDQPAIAEEAVVVPPRPAALSIRAAYLPDDLRECLKEKPILKEMIAFTKVGIGIDPKTGCAKENFLRFEEMVRAGATLKASCQLDYSSLEEDQQKAIYALLVVSTKMVERLGGKRRRGAGLCKLSVDKDFDAALSWLEKHSAAPELPKSFENILENPTWNTSSLKKIDDWCTVGLEIKALTPIAIPKRTIGNITECLDYIPGTHLLRLVRRKLNGLGVDLDYAIAHGQLVLTNATLEINQHPGRATPLALFGSKLNGGLGQEKGRVINRLVESETTGEGQLKQQRDGYISPISENVLTHGKVQLGIKTHNTISDAEQRPTEEVGGVYSYQAIAAHTVFRAELRLTQGLLEQLNHKDTRWHEKLVGHDALGQSRKDDYGAIKITVSKPESIANQPQNISKTLTVWLLSDLLLRDERLRPTVSIESVQHELTKDLGVTLKLREDKDLMSALARPSRLESWQVRWGLPRPSLVGLAAGSCIVFTVEGELDAKKLSSLEITGLGERRSEGFGQLCFNDPLLLNPTSELTMSKLTETKSDSQAKSKLMKNNDDYARFIETAAWREAIRRSALSLAANTQDRKRVLGIHFTPDQSSGLLKSKPTMSQLGGLRSVINRIESVESKDQSSGVCGWIKHLKKSDNRIKSWNDSDSSLEKIMTLVTNSEKVWGYLNLPYGDITLTSAGDRDLKKILWAEAVKTLVDACIRAHKRDSEDQPGAA